MGDFRGDQAFFSLFSTPALAVGWAMLWCGWGVALVLFDETSRRLPNPLTYGGGVLAGAVALLYEPAWLWGGLVWAALYLLVGISGGGVGGGDIKAAFPLGVIVGSYGFPMVVLAMLLASVLTAVRAISTASRAVAHGPAMVLASAMGVFWAGM